MIFVMKKEPLLKISLGEHETSSSHLIQAWIEPGKPRYMKEQIFDTGMLHVKGLGSNNYYRQYESASENLWKLADEIGLATAKPLFAELVQYGRKPFFQIYDHAQFGRMYMELCTTPDGQPAVAIFTRPNSLYTQGRLEVDIKEFDGASLSAEELRWPQEGLVVPIAQADAQLQMFFSHESLGRLRGLVPDSSDLHRAIECGKHMSEIVLSRYAQFHDLVNWDYIPRLKRHAEVPATGKPTLKDQITDYGFGL